MQTRAWLDRIIGNKIVKSLLTVGYSLLKVDFCYFESFEVCSYYYTVQTYFIKQFFVFLFTLSGVFEGELMEIRYTWNRL